MRVLTAVMSAAAMLATYGFCTEAFRSEGRRAAVDRPGASRATGRSVGLTAAAMVAISLPQVRAGWEVRMYSLGTALAALGGWTLFRALRTPAGASSNHRWAVHGLVTLAMAYTHPYLLFSVAAQAVFLAGYFLTAYGGTQPSSESRRGAEVVRAAVTYAAVVAGWGPWAPVLFRQTKQVRAHFWTSPLDGWDLPNRCYEMFLDGPPSRAAAAVAALACAFVLLLLAVVGRAGHWFSLLSATVPFSLGATVSALGANVFIARYLVFAQLFLLIGIAALLAEVRWPHLRWGLTAALLAGGAAVDVAYLVDLDVGGKPGMRAAVAYLKAHRRPGEPVIVTSSLLYFQTAYYMNDPPSCKLLSYGRPFVHYAGGAFVEDSDLISAEQLPKLAAGRVWVISPEPRAGDFSPPENWSLHRDEEFREVFQFDAVFVDDFEPAAP